MKYIVDATHIFTMFFIMLGPVKLIIPYAHATQTLNRDQVFRLSFLSVLAAMAIAVAGGYCGKFLLIKWGIQVPVLMLSAGIIFFLVALRSVIPQPAAVNHGASSPGPAVAPDIMHVVFPMLLTPYGMAAVIALLTASTETNRTLTVLGLLLANMALNFLAMIYVRPILKRITPTGMQIIFSVLGVLMVALALQIVVNSLTVMNILPAAG